MSLAFKSKLTRSINDFNSAVKKLLKKVAPNVVFSGVIIHSENEADEYDVMANFLNLPQAPKSHKRTENVFLVGLLDGATVDREALLISYNTEISYCRQTNPKTPNANLRAMSGFHFDFDCGEKKFNHPIFHAQPKLTAGSRFFARDSRFVIPEYPQHEEIRTLRIPTPQMDIFSSIVMILADHIIDPEDAEKDFHNFKASVARTMIPFDLEPFAPYVPARFKEANPQHVAQWYPTK